MPVFQAQVAVRGGLHLSQEFEYDGYRFSPTSDGFNLIFEVEAVSPEDAQSQVAVTAQLLLDSLTFTKGPSLRYDLGRIAEKTPTEQGPSHRVLTTRVYMTADAYLVLAANQAEIRPALEMASYVSSHPKSELLTRALRWYSRGVSDSDNTDRFVDFWVALEALADSYKGKDVQPQYCPKCGSLIKSRPMNGVLRAYLRSLGMKEEAESISAISSARGALFHRAIMPKALKYLPEVQRILKTCIRREIGAR